MMRRYPAGQFGHGPRSGVNRNESVTVRGAPSRECAHWVASRRILLPSFTIHDHGILGIMEYMRHICVIYVPIIYEHGDISFARRFLRSSSEHSPRWNHPPSAEL